MKVQLRVTNRAHCAGDVKCVGLFIQPPPGTHRPSEKCRSWHFFIWANNFGRDANLQTHHLHLLAGHNLVRRIRLDALIYLSSCEWSYAIWEEGNFSLCCEALKAKAINKQRKCYFFGFLSREKRRNLVLNNEALFYLKMIRIENKMRWWIMHFSKIQ